MDIRTKLVLALVTTALFSMVMLGFLNYRLSIDLYLQNSNRQLAAMATGSGAARRESTRRDGTAPIWLNVFDGIPITVLALYLRRDRIFVEVRASWKPGVLAGIISLLAYWIVIWAMTQAPMALVSAVRETSMVFAVLFGVFFLKERLNLARLASTAITLCGTVMIKMSK